MSENKSSARESGSSRRRAYLWLLSHKALYQRLWGGRGAQETPIVLFLAGSDGAASTELAALFKRSLRTQVHPPGDPALFDGGKIRPDHEIRSLIARSHAPIMVFAVHPASRALASLVGHFQPARALWFYEPPGYFSASLNRPGEVSAADMPDSTRQLIDRLDQSSLSGKSRDWLAWHARHMAFFDAGLDRDRSTRLVASNRLCEQPETSMREILEFAGLDGTRDLAKISKKKFQSAADSNRGSLDPDIRTACEDLLSRLDAVEARSSGVIGHGVEE